MNYLRSVWLAALIAATGELNGAPNVLPEPSGPHAVGAIAFDWVDSDRSDPLAEDSQTKRRLAVRIWYPAKPGTGTAASYLRDPQYWAAVHGEQALHINHAARPHARNDAEPSAKPERMPVVLFSPGANQPRRFYQSLFEEWASRGFAVAAIAHPHANRDIFTDGTRMSAHGRWSPPGHLREVERDKELYAFWDPMIECLSADQRFVLERLADLDAGRIQNPLAGRLDLEHVVVAGHSRGAKAAFRTARQDGRVSGCVVLDDPPPPPERSGLPVPVLVMMPEEAFPAMRAHTAELFANSRKPMFWASLEKASHMSFSDLPLLAPDEFDLTASEAREINNLVRRVTSDFLRFCIDGEPRGVLRTDRQTVGVSLRTKNVGGS